MSHPSAAKAATKTKTASQSRVILALPVFNEASNLPKFLDRVDRDLANESVVYRVVAVDDGSTDDSLRVLSDLHHKLPLDVVRHGVNKGLGKAIESGLMRALEIAEPDEIIVTMDADDTHLPALIPAMIDRLNSGADVVIASRFRRGARCLGVPLYRRFVSSGASWLFRFLFPTRGVRDFTCGFRAYRVPVLQKALEQHGEKLFEFEGFHCMVDLLLKLRKSGARFAEVPIILRYDRKEGPPKMPVLRTTLRTLTLAFRRRLGL
jgi:dolichol-phosphate mannosyltransferase